MERLVVSILALMVVGNAAAFAASAVNKDSEPHTLFVTEHGSQSEVVIDAGETLEFCPSGCFVTMPNGDREVLSGGEEMEISGGRARIK